MRAWAQQADTSLGLSESAALANASALGNMLTQMGSSRDQAAAMSKQMVETSADLAAFNRVSGGAAKVLDTMSSAFRGEYDALQRFLPAITDAAIKQQALAETGKANADQLTAQEKALATYSLILQGAAPAQGAMADAIERGAAAGDIFAAKMEDMRAQVGQVGLIIQQEFFQTLNELLEEMGFYGENIVEQLVVGLTRGLTFITPYMAQLRQVFVTLLQPHSPPKLLPELNDWGRAAAEEYLKGWTQADGSILETLGSTIENALRSFAGAGNLKETDLVARVFGSQRAIVDAVNEWRSMGFVTVGALDNIRRAAGPAGDAVGDLVGSYFDLQNAAKRAADAQRGLDDVTRRYDATLSPLQRKLDDLQDAQQRIRDQQRLEELGEVIKDPRATTDARRLARLEAEEIQLRSQVDAIEEEKNAALQAEQEKINAAERERAQKQAIYDQGQLLLDQQIKSNELMAEEINLRTRLAEEARAKEEKAAREREAERKKEEAELERIGGAQLRYRLQLADTEGDLAIMREELAKVTEGSAEYYEILTDIARLEEKLADERARGGGEDDDPVTEAGKAARENKPYMEDFRKEFEKLLQAMSGTGDAPPVKLTPFFENIVTGFENIKDIAKEVIPTIQEFIDFFFVRDQSSFANQTFLPSIGGGTGSGGNSIMGKIYDAVTGTLTALRRIFTGDWQPLWNDFKSYVTNLWGTTDAEDNPLGWTILDWIVNTFIPAMEALAVGDWKTAWESLSDAPDSFNQNLYATIDAIDAVILKIQELLTWLSKDMTGGNVTIDPDNPEWAPPPGGPMGGWGELNLGWWKQLYENLEAYLDAIGGGGPPSSLQPQSYDFGGISPMPMPDTVAASASGATSSESNVYYINQQIAANGDFGGARQGAAEGIRQALLQRRLQGI